MFSRESQTQQQTQHVGEVLAGCVRPDDVIVLAGMLGAGKTQLVKGLARGLGVAEGITSPTFPILVEYEGVQLRLLHFDLYRLEHEDELDDVDFFGALESGCVSAIEWGDKFADAMPDERLDVTFAIGQQGCRMLRFTGIGARGGQLERELEQALAE